MKARYSLFLFCLLLLSFPLFAQWHQTNGPDGGNINEIARYENTVFAATRGGLFFSQDEGLNWLRHPVVPSHYHVRNISVIDNEILMLVYVVNPYSIDDFTLHLYRSLDGGISWTNHQLDLFFHVYESGEFFRSGDYLFLWFWNGFYRSEDDGVTWEEIGTSLPYLSEYAYHNGQILVNTSDDILYLSEDHGFSWQPVEQDLSYFNLLFFEENILLVSRFDSLYVAESPGAPWTAVNTPYDYIYGKIERGAISGRLYLHQGGFLFSSPDNGLNWDTLQLAYIATINNLLETADDELLLATDKGVYRTKDDSQGWLPSSTGIRVAWIYELDRSSTGEFFTRSDAGTFRSPNQGLSWFPWPMPTSRPLNMLFQNDTCYLVQQSGQILRSTDNAQSFDDITPPDLTNYLSSLLQYANGRLWIISDQNLLLYSEDAGDTWTSIEAPSEATATDLYNMMLIFPDGELLLANEREEQVFHSADDGETWNVSANYEGSTFIKSRLVATDEHVLLIARDGWKVSYDQGSTWAPFPVSGLPVFSTSYPGPVPSKIIQSDGLLFAITTYNGVFVSSNFGSTWQPSNQGLTNTRQYSLIGDDDLLVIGGKESSVWTRAVNFSSISGYIYLDQNGNGEPDTTEPPLNNVLVNATPLNTFTTSNSDGTYQLIGETLNDTVRITSPSAYATVEPAYYLASEQTEDLDFGVYLEPEQNDLSITLTDLNILRPGFETSLFLTVENQGTTALSPQVSLKLPEGFLVTGTSIAPDTIINDSLSWTLPELQLFTSTNLEITVWVPFNYALGTWLDVPAYVRPIVDDQTPANNTATLRAEIRGGYDPNDKQVSTNLLTPSDLQDHLPLEYTVRFQNTGNFRADNVRIIDTLDENLDLSSLKIMATSHQPMNWFIRDDRVLEFVFPNIFLPDSTSNQLGSQGFVKFSIEPNATLLAGEEIENTANIYFDFNPAIFTNTVTTTLIVPNTTHEAVPVSELKVYPNPGQAIFNLQLTEKYAGSAKVSLYNVNGRGVNTSNLYFYAGQATLQLPYLPNGNYLIEVMVQGKLYSGKLLIVH